MMFNLNIYNYCLVVATRYDEHTCRPTNPL